MTTLQEQIMEEINSLPLILQEEVLDFVLFLKQKYKPETDIEFLENSEDDFRRETSLL